MANEFTYFKENDLYGTLFLQFPRVLIYGNKYRKLSTAAKIAYIALKDRLDVSMKNRWVDDEGQIYFNYSVENLAEVLNCSKKTAIKYKKELADFNLLKEVQVGLNRANKLYLGNLDLESSDVFLKKDPLFQQVHDLDIQGNVKNDNNSERGSIAQKQAESLGTSGSVKTTLPSDDHQSLSTSGSVKTTLPEKQAETLGISGSVKITPESNLDYLDTSLDTSLDTQSENSEKLADAESVNQIQNQKLERELLSHFADATDKSTDFLNHETRQMIAMSSESVQEAKHKIGIILNAKRDVENQAGLKLVIEFGGSDRKAALYKTLMSVLMKTKDGSKIDNFDNYLYRSFTNEFEQMINEELVAEKRAAYRGEHNPMAQYHIPVMKFNK